MRKKQMTKETLFTRIDEYWTKKHGKKFTDCYDITNSIYKGTDRAISVKCLITNEELWQFPDKLYAANGLPSKKIKPNAMKKKKYELKTELVNKTSEISSLLNLDILEKHILNVKCKKYSNNWLYDRNFRDEIIKINKIEKINKVYFIEYIHKNGNTYYQNFTNFCRGNFPKKTKNVGKLFIKNSDFLSINKSKKIKFKFDKKNQLKKIDSNLKIELKKFLEETINYIKKTFKIFKIKDYFIKTITIENIENFNLNDVTEITCLINNKRKVIKYNYFFEKIKKHYDKDKKIVTYFCSAISNDTGVKFIKPGYTTRDVKIRLKEHEKNFNCKIDFDNIILLKGNYEKNFFYFLDINSYQNNLQVYSDLHNKKTNKLSEEFIRFDTSIGIVNNYLQEKGYKLLE